MSKTLLTKFLVVLVGQEEALVVAEVIGDGFLHGILGLHGISQEVDGNPVLPILVVLIMVKGKKNAAVVAGWSLIGIIELHLITVVLGGDHLHLSEEAHLHLLALIAVKGKKSGVVVSLALMHLEMK